MDLAWRNIDRIVVRGTNWVGDALMTTPALAAVRENFPKAHIAVVAKPWVAPVYADHPGADEVIVFDSRGRHRGAAGMMALAKEIRQGRFDLAVLFQNAFQAALIVRLARVPLRLGFNTDARGFLLNRPVRLTREDKAVHETEYYLRLLCRAGLAAAPRTTPPVFHLSEQAREKAGAILDELGCAGNFLVGLAPGAAFGTAKRWPAERYARAADLILEKTGGAALVFGSASEADVTRDVAASMSRRAFDLAGRTSLAEAAALIERCSLFLTNDSGLMHVAAAVGAPLVAVFGPTNPVTTSPVGERVRLIRHPVPCSPCLKPDCPLPEHKCMDLVRPEETAAAGLELVEELRRPL